MNQYTIINVIRDLITGKIKFATRSTVKKRSNVCSVCEVRNSGVCTACGCIIALKVRLHESQCPMELW